MPLFSLGVKEDVPKILTELAHESDRAAGIVGAVLVEGSLTALIQSRMVADEDIQHELMRPSGPLGAFSVKINLGYLLGLFTPAARKELDTIKEIRNEFAHRVARSFEFDRIRQLANNLTLCESVEFYMVPKTDGTAVLYIGAMPPDGEIFFSVLPEASPEQLAKPRERYLRACQFYSGALLMTAHILPKGPYPVYF